MYACNLYVCTYVYLLPIETRCSDLFGGYRCFLKTLFTTPKKQYLTENAFLYTHIHKYA